jgi:fibronectin-binding autotransporter adhesin
MTRLAALLATVGLLSGASAQDVTCGTGGASIITGEYDNVFVNGGSCTIDGAAVVRGNVLASGGGSLDIRGTTSIAGSVSAESAGTIAISGGTVTGSVFARDSLGVSVTGGTLSAGLSVESGRAGLTVCGGTIIGGITLSETTGALSIGQATTCALSTIDGNILVTKGTGAIAVTNAALSASDIIVSEQTGNIDLNGVNPSDLSIELVTGSVSLSSLSTDSDSTVKGITGALTVTGSSFQGDLAVSSNGAITLIGNDFNFEDVLLEGGTGNLRVENNVNLGITITERGLVTFIGNDFTQALLSKNGVVTISGNTGLFIDCVDNAGIVGSGNAVATALGQCASI